MTNPRKDVTLKGEIAGHLTAIGSWRECGWQ